MKSLVILSLLLVVVYATPDPCNMNVDCGTCVTNHQTCGWCAATQTCVTTEDGAKPKDGKCLVGWYFGTCPDCEAHSGLCHECNQFADCKWCSAANEGKGGCFHISKTTEGCTGGGLVPHTCDCNDYRDCGSCHIGSKGSCSWCKIQNTCMPTETAKQQFCFVDPTCSPTPADCALHGLSCQACHQADGCVFCQAPDGSTSCVKEGQQCPNDGLLRHNCAATCAQLGTCEKCTTYPGCHWCTKNTGPEVCIDDANIHECVIGKHTCAGSSGLGGGFRFGDFVGGMFLCIVLIGLVIGGVGAWRYKQGKPIYTRIQ